MKFPSSVLKFGALFVLYIAVLLSHSVLALPKFVQPQDQQSRVEPTVSQKSESQIDKIIAAHNAVAADINADKVVIKDDAKAERDSPVVVVPKQLGLRQSLDNPAAVAAALELAEKARHDGNVAHPVQENSRLVPVLHAVVSQDQLNGPVVSNSEPQALPSKQRVEPVVQQGDESKKVLESAPAAAPPVIEVASPVKQEQVVPGFVEALHQHPVPKVSSVPNAEPDVRANSKLVAEPASAPSDPLIEVSADKKEVLQETVPQQAVIHEEKHDITEKAQPSIETSRVVPTAVDNQIVPKSGSEQEPHLLKSGEKSAELKSQAVPDPVVVVSQAQQASRVETGEIESQLIKTPPAQASPAVSQETVNVASQPERRPRVVMGGLGPLNLLAETLCSSQPERLIASDELNALYAKRASLRKSLYALMSLKFTHLDKLSSRLNYANIAQHKAMSPEVQMSAIGASNVTSHATITPSHGWPVVGKCTAHDLKLMAEAAWCEDRATDYYPVDNPPPTQVNRTPRSLPDTVSEREQAAQSKQIGDVSAIPIVATITSRGQTYSAQDSADVVKQAQAEHESSLTDQQQKDQAYSYSAVVSKVLHVNQSPSVEEVSSSGSSLHPDAIKQRECRRKALRLSKALFNHLAENQAQPSESWPQLYAALYEDECARKRVIDIVSALSNFKGESSSTIRRDNVEFAFAMDDLRPKVLKSEVNAPLTFDRQFIEVEQFLQQSVKLLMSNIDPERAKLTQLRYRSLMHGPVVADDQCVELHQRLLAKNYPTDCNPNQFGQLTDVLRMTAMSLELWSVETDLAKAHAQNPLPPTHKLIGIPDDSLSSQPVSAEALHDCIAYLVVS